MDIKTGKEKKLQCLNVLWHVVATWSYTHVLELAIVASKASVLGSVAGHFCLHRYRLAFIYFVDKILQLP